MKKHRVIIVMGVAGSGKSTVGALLASRNHGRFFDADDYHPEANIRKMESGVPLDDTDRAPWLAKLRDEVIDATPSGGLAVLACSALRKSYRERLGVGSDGIALVYLKGEPELLTRRLATRSGHYMKGGMLESQIHTLEPPGPEEGFTVSIDQTAEEIVAEIERECIPMDGGGKA